MNWFGLTSGGQGVTVELIEGNSAETGQVVVAVNAADHPGGVYVTDIQMPIASTGQIG